MRMWQQANGWLAGSAVVFAAVAYWHAQTGYWWGEWLYYIAQAALIGSVADWFAVSALFSKPLGIPWHTDLVVKHRRELVAGIGRITQEKLVRPELWSELLANWSPTAWAARYWADPAKRAPLLAVLRRGIEARLVRLDGRAWVAPAARLVRERLKDLDFAAWLAKGGEDNEVLAALAMRGGQAAAAKLAEPAVYEYLRREAEALAAAKTKGFWGSLGRAFGEATGVLDYEEIASRVQAALVDVCERIARPGTAEHEDFIHTAREVLAVRLNEPDARGIIRGWQSQCIAELPVEKILDSIRAEFVAKWVTPAADGGSRLGEEAIRLVERAVAAFFADGARCAAVDASLRAHLLRFGQAEHGRIGEVAVSVLEAYDEQRLNDFVRSKVEDELARIRINGAVVGAVIGALAWAVLEFIYAPLVG